MTEFNYPTDDCNHCGEESEMTPENTRFNLYDGFPLANHFFTVCEHCEEPTRIFTQNTGDEAAQIGYEVYDKERVPSPQLAKWVLQAYEIPLIKPQELTPRQENRIDYFHYLMQSEVTVMDFMP